MIANKALVTAAVLLFAAPAAPALAHDDDGDYGNRWGYHREWRNWDDHDGWRRYGWRGYGWHRYGWRPYYGGGYYGGWRPYYRPYYRSWRYDRGDS
jgi:hypothetical protein